MVFSEGKVLLTENRNILQHFNLKSNVCLQPRTIRQGSAILNGWCACQKESEDSSKHFMNDAPLICSQESAWEHSDTFGHVLDAVQLCQPIQQREVLGFWTQDVLKRDTLELYAQVRELLFSQVVVKDLLNLIFLQMILEHFAFSYYGYILQQSWLLS